MNILKDLWIEHIVLMSKQIDLCSFTNKTSKDWFIPLINSLADDGTMPYLLETEERYRASPLSSIISCLDDVGLLPINVLDKMQDKLIFLRDGNILTDKDPGKTFKLNEDKDGWSLGEGVSVWSTSLAIIALFDSHGNGARKAENFKASILWLAKQYDINAKGWAYQLSANCSVNPIMTALALRALALSLTKPYNTNFNFTADEERQICSSIMSGIDYLKENCHKTPSKTYWCFNDNPHCAATTWVLLAFYQLSIIEKPFSQDCFNYFNQIIENSLTFILSKMPNKVQKWPDEQIVYEGGAKYNKQKNYFSYSATLLPQLFTLGLSPFHPKVINQIKWLINNPEDWKITGYNKRTVCSFTYAMVLATLSNWLKSVGVNLAPILTATTSKYGRFSELIWGFYQSQKSPFQLILKRRIWLLGGLLFLLIAMFAFGHKINEQINILSNWIIQLWDQTPDDRHDIMINIVATFVYAVIIGSATGIFNFIKFLARRHKK